VSETPETKEAMAWRLAWLHFVSSLSMADHMGDASNYARVFAEEMGLPMPPDDAELEEWSSWAVEQGLDDEDSGIYSDAFKAVAKARELGGSTAGPLSPEGKAESPSVSALLTLQEGLKEYGQHKPTCALVMYFSTLYGSARPPSGCSCGFSALLSSSSVLKDDQPDLPRCVCGGINEQTGQSSCLGHGIAVLKDDQ
jgi:hypothetical protein